MKRTVEILSPAGSYESLKAAIAAGADAVYVGGRRFGARAYANNLDEAQLLEAIDYVHFHGRKIYLTINTLFKENEIRQELYEYLKPYYDQGLDAVIVQDMGVLQFVREHFPDLPIHASTQMTVTNVRSAEFLKNLGVERVVTSRELQLEEIAEISEKTGLEIESFVHGALCYCYSGQCLYSSLIGGRSGNRGQCAQPCRLPYRVNHDREASYVLSLKDICTLESIPELLEAGIDSLKIEGRMKKPEYVALVTAMYRKYVDLYLKNGKKKFLVDPKDKQALMDLYNRGGFHGGYYHTRNGRKMVSIYRPNHAGVPALKVVKQKGKEITAKALVELHAGDVMELPDQKENYTFSRTVKAGEQVAVVTHNRQSTTPDMVINRIRNESLIRWVQEELIQRPCKEKVEGYLTLKVSEPARFVVVYGEIVAEVIGEVVQEAKNQPVEAARIEKQMRKTGNTEFEFSNLEICLDGNVFVAMQNLNELRRNALEELQHKIVSTYRRNNSRVQEQEHICSSSEQTRKPTECFYVYVETKEQFDVVVQRESVKRIYLDCNVEEQIWNNVAVDDYIAKANRFEKELFLVMPYIFRTRSIQHYEQYYDVLFQKGWKGILVRNLESYQFLREHGYVGEIVTDCGIYQFNSKTKEFWMEQQISHATAPLELNYRELEQVGIESSELVVYGYLPMMVSAQCVVNTTKGCRKHREYTVLKDRYQKEFVVKNFCDDCYNVIYNTAPLALTDQKMEIRNLAPKALRLHFTIEGEKDVKHVMELYEKVFVEDTEGMEPDFAFTRGHFKRGIK